MKKSLMKKFLLDLISKTMKVLWILHGMKVERFFINGTCRMGTDVSSSVVDESLNVHGTQGL